MHASEAVIGIVKTHAQMIRFTMPHLTALSRLVAPTPMIELATT